MQNKQSYQSRKGAAKDKHHDIDIDIDIAIDIDDDGAEYNPSRRGHTLIFQPNPRSFAVCVDVDAWGGAC